MIFILSHFSKYFFSDVQPESQLELFNYFVLNIESLDLQFEDKMKSYSNLPTSTKSLTLSVETIVKALFMQVNTQRTSTHDVKEKVALTSSPVAMRQTGRSSLSGFSPKNSPSTPKFDRIGGRKGIVIGERKVGASSSGLLKSTTPTNDSYN
jgi:hypothetical protein